MAAAIMELSQCGWFAIIACLPQLIFLFKYVTPGTNLEHLSLPTRGVVAAKGKSDPSLTVADGTGVVVDVAAAEGLSDPGRIEAGGIEVVGDAAAKGKSDPGLTEADGLGVVVVISYAVAGKGKS